MDYIYRPVDVYWMRHLHQRVYQRYAKEGCKRMGGIYDGEVATVPNYGFHAINLQLNLRLIAHSHSPQNYTLYYMYCHLRSGHLVLGFGFGFERYDDVRA